MAAWAALLVEERHLRAWDQADVVDRLADGGVIVSRSAIAMWERATNGPTRENAAALARLFGDTRLVTLLFPIYTVPEAPASVEQLARLAGVVRRGLSGEARLEVLVEALDVLLAELEG